MSSYETLGLQPLAPVLTAEEVKSFMASAFKAAGSLENAVAKEIAVINRDIQMIDAALAEKKYDMADYYAKQMVLEQLAPEVLKQVYPNQQVTASTADALNQAYTRLQAALDRVKAAQNLVTPQLPPGVPVPAGYKLAYLPSPNTPGIVITQLVPESTPVPQSSIITPIVPKQPVSTTEEEEIPVPKPGMSTTTLLLIGIGAIVAYSSFK